jgi:hypothetical protein
MIKRPRNAAVEGRTVSVRPSPRLYVLTLLVTLVVGVAEARAAEPPIPSISGTNPPSTSLSPAFQPNPLVFGEAEPGEGHTSSIPAEAGESPFFPAATKHPEYEIKLYVNDPSCSIEAAKGGAEVFEAGGIEVTVPANFISIIYARQVDPSDPTHPSACSSPRSYWEGTIAGGSPGEVPGGGGSGGSGGVSPGGSGGANGASGRPEPPQLHTNPGGTANDNTPLVTGSAPGAATVKIFAQPDCGGPVVVKGSAAQFQDGLKVQVPDNVVVAFSGISVGAGGQSRCSSPVYYTEYSTAPHTRITMGPASKTAKRKVVFRFTDTTGDAPGTAFFCKVDKAKWKQCSSPLKLRRLRLRKHKIAVKAIDPAGNVELKAAKRKFRVIRHP